MKILIVEDESTIREVEKAYLLKASFNVVEADDGKKAIEIFGDAKPDLIVLDLNLPGLDGIEVCKEIRKISNVPIIMVTARVEEIDELLGLELGADDYLKKPFSPNILVARVQNLLKRTTESVIEYGNIRIDPERMLVVKNGVEISYTTTQFKILHLLASNPGKVYTRDDILDRLAVDLLPKDVLDRTIDAHIKSIRKKLEDDTKHPKYIQTVIGRGYRFVV